MRDRPSAELEAARRTHPFMGRSPVGSMFGYFKIGPLHLISTGGDPRPDQQGYPWEHVSVSRSDGKTPSWEDMKRAKELFWHDHDTVVEFHPRKCEYVNRWEVLHLWRRVDQEYELPPQYMV
jgi:hypothetical protein